MVASAAVAMLAGCATSPPDSDTVTRSQALWDARTEFVGDNSRVAALVSLTSPAPEGKYTLSLETDRTPYGLTVHLIDPGKPCRDISSEQSEQLLLGLIANLDRVTVTCEGEAHTATASDASTALGFDVKTLVQDKDQLAAYLDDHADPREDPRWVRHVASGGELSAIQPRRG